jgi:hypothetical protein
MPIEVVAQLEEQSRRDTRTDRGRAHIPWTVHIVPRCRPKLMEIDKYLMTSEIKLMCLSMAMEVSEDFVCT